MIVTGFSNNSSSDASHPLTDLAFIPSFRQFESNTSIGKDIDTNCLRMDELSSMYLFAIYHIIVSLPSTCQAMFVIS